MNIVKHRKELKSIFKKYKNIFIMGHDGLDLDALGSSIGIYQILTEHYNRSCHLVIDEQEHELGCEKIMSEIIANISMINSREIPQYLGSKNLLIIMDCNKKYLLQNPKLVDTFEKILIIDHHEMGDEQIDNAIYCVDEESSSTCEMIAEFMYYYNLKVDEYTSTLLLSGIVLDTNNFVLRTTSKTYFAAYYLTTLGANPRKVQYLLKQDIEDYIIRQRVITDVEVIHHTIALAVGSQRIKYKKEELAKIADTLLQFNNIESSYVIGKLDDERVGLSIRSIGTVDASEVAEKFGGGGSKTDAAAQIEKKNLNEVHDQLLEVFRQEGNK